MLTDVFGEVTEPDEPGDTTVSDEDVATDEEVIQMLNEVYGKK